MENTLLLDKEEGSLAGQTEGKTEVNKEKGNFTIKLGYRFFLLSCILLLLGQLFLTALAVFVIGSIVFCSIYWSKFCKDVSMDFSSAFNADQNAIEEECYCPFKRK